MKLLPDKIGRIEIRPVSKADLLRFYGEEKYPTVSGFIGVLDGEPVCLGGLAFVYGYIVAFFDIREGARPYRLHIMAMMKSVMDEAKKKHRVILAKPEDGEPTAPKLLKVLGFEPSEDYNGAWKWVRETEDGGARGGSGGDRQRGVDAGSCAAGTIAGGACGLSAGGAEEGGSRGEGHGGPQGGADPEGS